MLQKFFYKLALPLFLLTSLNAQTTPNKIMDKELKNAIEQEKKFAEEQKFYMGDEYNLKGAEVNPNSLENIEELENLDYFDMDDVYD